MDKRPIAAKRTSFGPYNNANEWSDLREYRHGEPMPEAKPRREMTILMVGETGVGKSTFINAIVNYFLFENMADAASNLKCLIPTTFEVYDDATMSYKECSFGDPDENECADKTQSSTQNCRCYKVELGDFSVKIIDTPGIADSRGVEKDQLNMKNILKFLSNYKELNAICVLLKPNSGKISVLFKYCILELLTHLNKSACDNILFLFTNARGTFYKPGDTAKPLRKILEEIRLKPPNVEIKFDRDNCFCFDSEAFRYLVAVANNVSFNADDYEDFDKSWQRSVKECGRLFKRIADIRPHAVQDTISINSVKTKIINFRKPIILIVESINKEINLCKKHERKIKEFSGDIRELEKELYTPALDIVAEQLDKPITVCSDPECCEKKTVGNQSKVHYKSICHKPCYLENSDGNIIGDSGLLDCQAFNKYETCGDGDWFDPETFHPDSNLECNADGRVYGFPSNRSKSETCSVCSHSYLTHLTINYETKVETKQVRDDNKHNKIHLNKMNINTRQDQINEINKKIKELSEELRFITECSAHFTRFLMTNAITPFNDALEDYIKYCISNEKKGNADPEVIAGLNDMLTSYNREKSEIERLAREGYVKANLTIVEINAKIFQLTGMKHYGRVIKSHMDLEARGLSENATACEKTIPVKMENSSTLTGEIRKLISKMKFW